MSDRPLPAARRAACIDTRAHESQFALLRQRRFAPFFWTQFFGAGNDNVLKFAFTVLVTYQLRFLAAVRQGRARHQRRVHPAVRAAVGHQRAAGRQVRQGDGCASSSRSRSSSWRSPSGASSASVPVLSAVPVPDGRALHAVRPGEVRLPAAASDDQGTGGNGMVEMGTFVAILLGTIIGGVGAGIVEHGAGGTGLRVRLVAIALVGRAVSSFVPNHAGAASRMTHQLESGQ